MLRTLLICGLVAGLCAGLVGFGFARIAGEGSVGSAISFEEAKAKAAGEPEEAPIVSRGTQRSVGLLTATLTYGVALGGIFALVFAAVYGRVANAPPARTAVWLAALAFAVLFLVPFVKYPSNPPAVGDPDTITKRTLLYLTMIAASILTAVAAVRLRTAARGVASLAPYATPLAVGAYVVVVGVVMAVMPGIHEVPSGFPANTLYTFRSTTVGLQLLTWTTIGLVFAFLAERRMRAAAPAAARTDRAMGVEGA